MTVRRANRGDDPENLRRRACLALVKIVKAVDNTPPIFRSPWHEEIRRLARIGLMEADVLEAESAGDDEIDY